MRPKSRVVSGLVLSALGYLAIQAPSLGDAQATEPPQSAGAVAPASSSPAAPAPAAPAQTAPGPAAPAQTAPAPAAATPQPATPTPKASAPATPATAETTATSPATAAAPAPVTAQAVAPTTVTAPAAPPEAPAPAENTEDAEATEATTAPEAPAEATETDAPPAQAYRQYNTLSLSTGGLHLQDAKVGTPGAFRIQLGLEYFSKDDVFYKDDEVEQQSQKLSWSWTATESLELFASLVNHGSSSTLPMRAEGGTLSALGDVNLGGKVGLEIAPGLYLGSALRVTLLPSVGSETGSLKNTSGGLSALLSADFRRSAQLPIIGRLNVDYFLDNSSVLIEDFEDRKYDQLENPEPREDELNHLINRFERFALGINRVDTLTIGLGVEAPLNIGHNMSLHPLAEWTIGLPINRQGYDCAYHGSNKRRGRISSAEDSCLEDLGLSGIPQKLTAGLRFIPPMRGLSTFIAVDVALTGTRRFSQETAPLPAYRLLFGAGFDLDPALDQAPASPTPQAAVATSPNSTTSGPEGRVRGVVVDRRTGAPIPNVQVGFMGTQFSPLATTEDGGFISYAFSPGAVLMDLRHPNYDTAQCAATVPVEGGEVPVSCSMQEAAQTGSLQGQLRDPFGSPVPYAVLKLSGPTTQAISANNQGYFAQGQLPVGTYRAQLEAPGYLARATSVRIQAQTQTDAELTLTPLPATNNVRLQDKQVLVSNLTFKENANELTASGDQIVAEIADLLLRYPTLPHVRVDAPGEGSLSQSRSMMLKERLVNLGIEEDRLEAVGSSPATVTITVDQ